MITILKQWQESVNRRCASQVFLRAFYLFWGVNILRMLPYGNQIWGPDAPVIMNSFYSGFDALTMLLNFEPIRAYYLWFVWVLVILLFLGVFGVHNVFTRILAWLLFASLHNANPEVSNGSYHLSQQLFFFSVFFVGGQEEKRFSELRNLLHNLAIYAIWIQVAMMYGMAGVQKLRGDLWVSGEAMALVLNLEEYSLSWVRDWVESNHWILQLLTFAGLFYQLSFPVLLWFSRIRPYLLLFGFAFHMFIVWIIGVADFGFALMTIYTIFLPEELALRIMRWFDSWSFRGDKALGSKA